MVKLTEEEKKKAKDMAKLWTEHWVKSMQRKGRKLTEKGVKKHRRIMELMAETKLLTEKSKKAK